MILPRSGAPTRVSGADEALMARSAGLPTTRADGALKTLSLAANKGVLWWLVGSVLAARKGPVRRGALRADVPYSRARFLLAVVTNSLSASHVYRQCDLPELDVRLLDGQRRVATDGEVGALGTRFRFRSRPSALTIYRG